MFIKLHLLNGEDIRINSDAIESYGEITENTYESSFVGATYIVPIGLRDDEKGYAVTETVRAIDRMLGVK